MLVAERILGLASRIAPKLKEGKVIIVMIDKYFEGAVKRRQTPTCEKCGKWMKYNSESEAVTNWECVLCGTTLEKPIEI